ncbi:hypothetical protein [Variovorax paradoxus]|uniref:hypothetical protein n=1 Tax=Variovorax paradoxus TaxID=34073 RepID=UPI0012938033|nr:hypothetical protein [Variovorax paradoxus]
MLPIVVALMDLLRRTIPTTGTSIVQFRKLHIAGMVLNVMQLGTVAWALTQLGL